MMERAEVELVTLGRTQTVNIPEEFQLETNRVAIQRDDQGNLILSPLPSEPKLVDWDDIFQRMDEVGFPEDFMAERDNGPAPVREPL